MKSTYIKIENACKSIKGNPILQNVSLQLEGGHVYGLQGKNGSGKTMLMRAVCGLIRLDSGSISINGQILHKDISFPKSIGILIENPSFLNNMTGFRNLKLLSDINDNLSDSEIQDILSRVGLDPSDKRVYRKYSLGMKQKLGIAAAVMGSPDIVILDEPINAIDQDGVLLVRDLLFDLKSKGTIIITACHDHNELELLSDVIIPIEKGRVLL